jgi:hypothetical protein
MSCNAVLLLQHQQEWFSPLDLCIFIGQKLFKRHYSRTNSALVFQNELQWNNEPHIFLEPLGVIIFFGD